MSYNGKAIPGALLDFGVYFYLNAKTLLAKGTGPYFYLPKLETAEEAALWTDIFNFAEDEIGLTRGTIKATVLIEVITATFEMEEILHVLKDYCVGLNCGWPAPEAPYPFPSRRESERWHRWGRPVLLVLASP